MSCTIFREQNQNGVSKEKAEAQSKPCQRAQCIIHWKNCHETVVQVCWLFGWDMTYREAWALPQQTQICLLKQARATDGQA